MKTQLNSEEGLNNLRKQLVEHQKQYGGEFKYDENGENYTISKNNYITKI